LVDIVDWYASPLGTFIWMYSEEKPPHVLPKFSMDKLVMQELLYRISTGFSARLHRKKKAPWPTLPLRISLYKIRNLKHANVEKEEFKIFTFGTKSFNLDDLHCFVKDHSAKVKFPWIHEACHWAKEDPWRYYHNFSRLNEPVGIAVEWLAKQHLGEHHHQQQQGVTYLHMTKEREILFTTQRQNKVAGSKHTNL